MAKTDEQVRRLREEMAKHGRQGKAAARAGMSRMTARKYLRVSRYPSQLRKPHTWQTRQDPFAEDWADLAARLQDAPELNATTLLEYLDGKKPWRYRGCRLLRTLQRRIRRWRAKEGPPKDLFFAQDHRPGEAFQTDFTYAAELGVTVQSRPHPHLICHVVLPYSNWEWGTVCHSESMAAIRRGVQAAAWKLGRVPEYHQTDNSTAATHDLSTGKRGFNEEYLVLMRHLGMTPRTIQIGKKHQNGDIEAANGVVKRRLRQHLLLRGDFDFESEASYESFVQGVFEKANRLRSERVSEELALMRALPARPLPEHREVPAKVAPGGTIRVDHNAYSTHSRLTGEWVRVRVFDERLEVYYDGEKQMEMPRLHGRGGHSINYRHVIWSLVKKPAAFARYRYRADLFPTETFRRAYDAIQKKKAGRPGDIEYLRILHLAASTMESKVEEALQALLSARRVPEADRVKEIVEPKRPDVPNLPPPVVDLLGYDRILHMKREAAF